MAVAVARRRKFAHVLLALGLVEQRRRPQVVRHLGPLPGVDLGADNGLELPDREAVLEPGANESKVRLHRSEVLAGFVVEPFQDLGFNPAGWGVSPTRDVFGGFGLYGYFGYFGTFGNYGDICWHLPAYVGR